MKKAVCVILCLLLAASLAGAGLLYAQTRRLRDENARLDAQAAERDTRIETLTAEAQASADSLAALSEQATEKDSELASLRAAVQDELRRCKYVKSFRLGVYGEGESGVTIVEFK